MLPKTLGAVATAGRVCGRALPVAEKFLQKLKVELERRTLHHDGILRVHDVP